MAKCFGVNSDVNSCGFPFLHRLPFPFPLLVRNLSIRLDLHFSKLLSSTCPEDTAKDLNAEGPFTSECLCPDFMPLISERVVLSHAFMVKSA